jgi:hypothetical protein
MGRLIGIGLYTPFEAGRLVDVPAAKITRWLKGHEGKRWYEPLWLSQVELDDGRVYLGFRDLMEIRVADLFIRAGISPQRVRAAIQMARDEFGLDHPLSTRRFRTDGKDIFLEIMEHAEDGQVRRKLLNTFRKQFAFSEFVEPSFKGVEFDADGIPALWRPTGRRSFIVLDPHRAFGQPIDEESSVPTAVLAAAAENEGVEGAAVSFHVRRRSVQQAVEFEKSLRRAA